MILIKKKVAISLIASVMAVFFSAQLIAANFPLEILNIKPAGTGAPAIGSSNRIFKAYPNIEYNIRAAVIGGIFPYTYSLSNNKPSWLNIDAYTGVISGIAPASGTFNDIELTVMDQEGTIAKSTWSINVTTVGFKFVNSQATVNGTGTITSPYNSILSMLNNGSTTDIIYFRSGVYTLPLYKSDSTEWDSQGCSLRYNGGRPNKWIACPGEAVTIDCNKHYLEAYGTGSDDIYLDGLAFTNCLSGVLFSYSGADYFTARRCDFGNLTQTKAGNNNYGYLYFTGLSDPIGYFKVIQDNKFHDYNSTAAIGSLYRCSKTLIEGNQFYNQTATGNSGIVAAIAVKTDLTYTTIRQNTFRNLASNCSAFAHSVNAGLQRSNFTDICFNLFYHPTGYIHPQLNSHANNQNVYIYRNTYVGRINIDYLDTSAFKPCGPYTFKNNVIQNTAKGIEYDYGNGSLRAVEIDNIKVDTGAVDSSGNLTSQYQQYVGSRGWQIIFNSDTMAPAIPSNVSVERIP